MGRRNWPKGSAIWFCTNTVNGHRFRVSLGTDDRKTSEIHSEEFLARLTSRKPPSRSAMVLFLGLHSGLSAVEISRLTWGDLASLFKQHANPH